MENRELENRMNREKSGRENECGETEFFENTRRVRGDHESKNC